jgi:hypothetical protein
MCQGRNLHGRLRVVAGSGSNVASIPRIKWKCRRNFWALTQQMTPKQAAQLEADPPTPAQTKQCSTDGDAPAHRLQYDADCSSLRGRAHVELRADWEIV